MPKKFEGHSMKFLGTLKTKRDWLFMARRLTPHAPPPGQELRRPVIISSLKWKWELYFFSVFLLGNEVVPIFSKLKVKLANTCIFQRKFTRNTGTLLVRLQYPLIYPPSILAGNYFKYGRFKQSRYASIEANDYGLVCKKKKTTTC